MLIELIKRAIENNRQSGSTTALVNLAKEKEGFVFMSSKHIADSFNMKLETDRVVHPNTNMEGVRAAPIFVDNEVFLKISEDFNTLLDAIARLSLQNSELVKDNDVFMDLLSEMATEKAMETLCSLCDLPVEGKARTKFKNLSSREKELRMSELGKALGISKKEAGRLLKRGLFYPTI